jgi:hypothetical protein
MHHIDMPLVYLRLDGDPFRLGDVTFIRLEGQELHEWKSKTKPPLRPINDQDVNIFARVSIPENPLEKISEAKQKVEESINILRAFAAPFGRRSETWQVAILSGKYSRSLIPVRINNSKFAGVFSTPTGSGPADLELRQHIVTKLDQSHWELLSYTLAKETLTKMQYKLLRGIQWLGESTKPDTNDSKYVKICFALETMIGGEPRDEDLKVRGVTAMLAERAAFILGTNREDRLNIDKLIRKHYGRRSIIVHDGKADVSLRELDEFGILIRKLTVALLEKCNEFPDINKLEEWIKNKRYSP